MTMTLDDIICKMLYKCLWTGSVFIDIVNYPISDNVLLFTVFIYLCNKSAMYKNPRETLLLATCV